MSVYKSIAKNYAANLFGMGVNFLNQIGMVPLFISMWGVDKYADWILITALSTFFTMSNMGLNQATNNAFAIKYQQKDFVACRKLLTNSFLFVLAVGGLFMLVVLVIGFLVGFKSILNTTVFTETETSIVFILLLFNVFVKMYGGVYAGIYRVKSYAHVSAMIDNIIQLSGLLILFLGILLQTNIIIVIIAYNIPALIGIVYRHYRSQKWFKISFHFQHFDWITFKSLVKPSLAFMLVPLGFAVTNQGMIFVVNALLGSTILVAFTTTRTLVNFLRSLINAFGNSIYPEISNAYGRQDKNTISKVYYRSFIITILTSLAAVILLLFAGKLIFMMWTNHAVVFYSDFFTSMLAVLFVSCLWGLSSVILLATNKHGLFTLVFLLTQVAGVIFSYISLVIYSKIEVVPIVLLITELSLLIFTMKEVNKLLESNFKGIFQEILVETKYMLKKFEKSNHL
ncbi:lipopolysaccharide biosynthesis protein [Parapedobacter sp. DT-150]|uniref:lipopolysaccharide biosynthesis protein n=1 Tax=Parapedobacter sp. DT-150 TaxID=3396162 RepID=UPI003F1CCFEC